MGKTNGDTRRSIPERSMTTSLLVDYLSGRTAFVSDDELSKACGSDVTKKAIGSMASARKIILSERNVWWKRIPKVGYEPAAGKDAPAIGFHAIGKMHREAHRAARRIEGCGDITKLDNAERVRLNAGLSVLGAIGQFTQTKTVRRLEGACQQKADKLQLTETLSQFGIKE